MPVLRLGERRLAAPPPGTLLCCPACCWEGAAHALITLEHFDELLPWNGAL